MRVYTYICEECRITFTRYWIKRHKLCFCSNSCRGIHKKKQRKTSTCRGCSKIIYLSWDKRQRRKAFCSSQCYWKYKKNTKYGVNASALKKARLYSNTEEAIQKRRHTKILNGSWYPDDLIVDGLTYKQYRRKVYRLTRMIKKVLFEMWDGYDYYDKTYIKNNLCLPKLHGDYPSIDHKTSIHDGFKLKIPPITLSSIDNLAITKRRINSSKREKSHQGVI